MGVYPSIAPRGYLNDKGTKTIVIDPTLAPIMKRAFEAYAEGNRTLDSMQDFLAEHGVFSKKLGSCNKGGMKVRHDRIRRMLRNPFYYGHFEYSGEVYEGKHQPIISKALFDKVQGVLEEADASYDYRACSQGLHRAFALRRMRTDGHGGSPEGSHLLPLHQKIQTREVLTALRSRGSA